MTPARIRVLLAQLIHRLAARTAVPLCPGGCRQPIDRPCRCDPRWRLL